MDNSNAAAARPASSIPVASDLAPYKKTKIYDECTVPAGFRSKHSTKPGVWGLIHILDGALFYTDFETGVETRLGPEARKLVLPQAPHSVRANGPVRFYVEFLRAKTPE